MYIKEISMDEAEAKALKTLESVRFVSFASNGPDGWPDVRMMTFAKHLGLNTLYFITAIAGKKNSQIVIDPKSVVYGYDPDSLAEFRLFGHAELFGDTETKVGVWRDEFDLYFPEGVYTPSLLVIAFQTKHGEYASPTDGKGIFFFD